MVIAAQLYRRVARELARTNTPSRNRDIVSSVRRLFERQAVESDVLCHDVENMLTFMRSQREYKTLVERYNPLVDLTAEERIEATARRVGLNMPDVVRDSE